MKNKQRQIIKDFSAEVYNSYSPHEAFIALADQWDLASNFEYLLGTEGRISFPVEKPQVDIGDMERELERLEELLTMVYDNERFNMKVSAPSNKLEIAVWDFKEEKQVVRKSYNKILDFLHKNSPEKESTFYSHSRALWRAEEVAQKVSQRSVKQQGTLYISALPEDILTASINNLGWSSCFDYEGENSVTPYHLVRSRRTLIAFFIPDNAEHRTMDYCGHEVYNKYWRTFIYQSTNGSFFASSSAYPEKSNALVTAALNKLMELDGREATITEKASTRYRLHGYCDGIGLAAVFDYEPTTDYTISSPHELCPLSKRSYDSDIDQSITCYEFTDSHECYNCGYGYRSDELEEVVISRDGDTEYYCDGCLEDTSYCEHSGYTYDTAINSDTASKFIDENGNVSDIATCYAEDRIDKYTLILYTDSETYETRQLYGEGVHDLLNPQQVEEIVESYRLPAYRLAILTRD